MKKCIVLALCIYGSAAAVIGSGKNNNIETWQNNERTVVFEDHPPVKEMTEDDCCQEAELLVTLCGPECYPDENCCSDKECDACDLAVCVASSALIGLAALGL